MQVIVDGIVGDLTDERQVGYTNLLLLIRLKGSLFRLAAATSIWIADASLLGLLPPTDTLPAHVSDHTIYRRTKA